jgi:DNA-binding MarR family transcriptional regulator
MNKSYYAVIPADVRYSKALKPMAKLLYGEISSLCNQEGYCWASNKYFADLYELSVENVSRLIKSLIKEGFIESKIYKSKGNTRHLTLLTKQSRPIDQKVNTPIDQKVNSIYNSKSINNKKNNPPTKLVAHSLRFYKTYGFPKKCNNQDKLINESADVLRKLIDIDGYSESEVVDAIRWAKENSFWSNQIISLRSLRDKKSDVMKFENLYNQFKADTDKPIDIVNQTVEKPVSKPEYEPTEEEYAEIEKAKAEAMAEFRNLKLGYV